MMVVATALEMDRPVVAVMVAAFVAVAMTVAVIMVMVVAPVMVVMSGPMVVGRCGRRTNHFISTAAVGLQAAIPAVLAEGRLMAHPGCSLLKSCAAVILCKTLEV